jgi:eukaryotic-like serine/threonine-protein kinase
MADQSHKVHTVFNNALECASDEERQRYLEQACRDAPDVRQRVEALLQAHFDPRNDVGEPALGMLPVGEQPGLEQPGTQIGHYHLTRQLGEGGMGVVFQAQQTEPLQRQVALKIIKPGMDTRQVIERFEAERLALAVMDHPHVAKVLDAGSTPSGRPYFVMLSGRPCFTREIGHTGGRRIRIGYVRDQ